MVSTRWILAVLVVGCDATNQVIRLGWFARVRGGDGERRADTGCGMVAVGFLGNESYSVQLHESNEAVQSLLLTGMGVEETLGIACDAVMIHQPSLLASDWKQQIARLELGAKRRVEAGFPKLRVVLVGSEQQQGQQQQVQQKWNGSYFDCKCVAAQSAEESLKDITEQRLSGGMASSSTEFRELLKQLHKTLRGEELEATSILQEHLEKEASVDSTDSSEILGSVLNEARDQIDALRSQQEEVWLNAKDKVPLLQFGAECNKILEKAWSRLKDVPSETKNVVVEKIASQMKRLFENQLSSLRDHYGSVYEKVLEQNPANEQALTKAAQRATENFRAAAQHAIPKLFQQDGELYDLADFGYVKVLRGLVNDMMEATELIKGMEVPDEVVEKEETDERPKWYKIVASRAIMLGVNYLQGWLAWQGIKRAAIKRDKEMPKFPLF